MCALLPSSSISRSLPSAEGSAQPSVPAYELFQTLQPGPGGCFCPANSTQKATGLFRAVPTSSPAFCSSPSSPLVRPSDQFHIFGGPSALTFMKHPVLPAGVEEGVCDLYRGVVSFFDCSSVFCHFCRPTAEAKLVHHNLLAAFLPFQAVPTCRRLS